MKKILIIVALFVFSIGNAQILKPVKWSTSTKKIAANEYELIFTATIEPGFHLYSQKVPENGPKPTLFEFEKSDNYELVGRMSEEKGHTAYDKMFDMNIKYFDNKAVFKQRIKLKKKGTIVGEIDFMSCNDASCVPDYFDFEFTL